MPTQHSAFWQARVDGAGRAQGWAVPKQVGRVCVTSTMSSSISVDSSSPASLRPSFAGVSADEAAAPLTSATLAAAAPAARSPERSSTARASARFCCERTPSLSSLRARSGSVSRSWRKVSNWPFQKVASARAASIAFSAASAAPSEVATGVPTPPVPPRTMSRTCFKSPASIPSSGPAVAVFSLFSERLFFRGCCCSRAEGLGADR